MNETAGWPGSAGPRCTPRVTKPWARSTWWRWTRAFPTRASAASSPWPGWATWPTGGCLRPCSTWTPPTCPPSSSTSGSASPSTTSTGPTPGTSGLDLLVGPGPGRGPAQPEQASAPKVGAAPGGRWPRGAVGPGGPLAPGGRWPRDSGLGGPAGRGTRLGAELDAAVGRPGCPVPRRCLLVVLVRDRRLARANEQVGGDLHALAPDRTANDLGQVDPVAVLAGDVPHFFQEALRQGRRVEPE